MKKVQLWGAAAGMISVLLGPAQTMAADPGAASSGFYAGGHVGYMFGNATATLADPIGSATAGGTTVFGGLFGGFQAGYEHVFPSSLMLGLELDASFPDYIDLAPTLSYRFTPVVSANEQLEFLSTLRGRIGYAMGSWTPYVTGGLALGSFREELSNTGVGLDAVQPGNLRLGYALGAGIDKKLDNRWSARFEYLYTALGLTGYMFNPQARYDSQYDFQRFRLGMNYHFGVDGDEEKKADQPEEEPGPGTWEVHGQTTFIFSGYPAFFSAIPDGPQSLPSVGQSRNTWTGSLFFGLRLWEGASLYYNPELLQGFGVASTTGLAGFPNGEAQKSNFPYPQYSTSRLFLRQTFGLGGETERFGTDYGQLREVEDVSRIEFQIGRFAVHDIFDTNDYAQDPRIDFLNWSIWASGAFDYAADKIGLTYGITAELNQADWAVRAGYFLVGDHPNSDVYDMNLFSRGMYDAELELRYRVLDHPGIAKFGGWMHNSFAGDYSDANALIINTGLNPTTAITQTRTGRQMWGYYVNWQQELADDIGMFARWSWNDGRSEISAFTDINSSISGGFSIKGVRWGRPDDTVGIAGAINQISPQLAGFLALGGTGILIGDGQLDYAPEHVLEAYYALQIKKGLVVTADYQLFVDPAYNVDRGPVHMFSGRLRASF